MPANELLFSVVIPTYNYAHTLTRAVESVLSQAGDDYELIVVNDGSSDNTDQVIQALQKQYSGRISYHPRDNVGAAATRNRGIEVSTGHYLVFLDADDTLTESALDHLRGAINRHPYAGMVIGGHIAVSPEHDGHRERYHRPGILPRGATARVRGYLLDKTIHISNGACALHRDVFARYRYPVQFKSSEDISVFAYILANFPATTIDQPIARIYKHADSLRHNLDYAQAVGAGLIDEVFDPERIPAAVQSLKQAFAVQRFLSLSRTFFLAGNYAACRQFFLYALRADWRVLFKWSYSRKALRAKTSSPSKGNR